MVRPNVSQKNVSFFKIKIQRQCEIIYLWYSCKALTSIALLAMISCLPSQGHIIHVFSLIFPFLTPDNHKSAFFSNTFCNGIFGFCLFSINILGAYHEMSSTHKLSIFNKLCFALHCAIPYLICLVWYNCSWIPHLPKSPVVI